MSQSLLLPAFVALFGVVAALFLLGYARPVRAEAAEIFEHDEVWDDNYVDDDDYIEFTVHHHEPGPAQARPVTGDVEGGDTEPLAARREHPLTEDREEPAPPTEVIPAVVDPPADPLEPPAHPREESRSLFDFLAGVPLPKPSVEPIGFAHNGFHIDDDQRFQPLSRFEAHEEPEPPRETRKPDVLDPDYPLNFGGHANHESPDEVDYEPPSRHGLTDGEREQSPFRTNGRHSRAESDDAPSYGRHSRPGD